MNPTVSDKHKEDAAQAFEAMAEAALKDAAQAAPGAASDLANQAAHLLRAADAMRGPGAEGGGNAKEAREAKDQVGRGDIGGGGGSQQSTPDSSHDPERAAEAGSEKGRSVSGTVQSTVHTMPPSNSARRVLSKANPLIVIARPSRAIKRARVTRALKVERRKRARGSRTTLLRGATAHQGVRMRTTPTRM